MDMTAAHSTPEDMKDISKPYIIILTYMVKSSIVAIREVHQMSLIYELQKTYGYDEPIMSNEIEFGNYSKPWIYKELNRLCKSGELVKYDRGVYYIPRTTRLGKSVLNPQKVIEKKYLGSSSDICGYYAGLYLKNKIGITTQMPNVIEVYTNNESSKVRDVYVGKQKVRLRKSRIEVTKENVSVLELLELMNSIDLDQLDQKELDFLRVYTAATGIKRSDITRYSRYFPEKALRNLIESEVIYDVAQ